VSADFIAESNFWFALSSAMPTPGASISCFLSVIRLSQQDENIAINVTSMTSFTVFIKVMVILKYQPKNHTRILQKTTFLSGFPD
jgi:hypothetical protein